MSLQQAIIHELIKERKQKDTPMPSPEIKEGTLLVINDDAVSTLVDSVRSIYGTKGNSSAQGTFNVEDESYVFPSQIDEFIAGNRDFTALSLSTMSNLRHSCKDKNLATGGYLIFGHYYSTVAGNEYDMLLIAMVKRKSGITLKDLVPEKIQEVDLSKLHQAVRIDLNKYKLWREHKDHDVNPVSSYLTFVSPKQNEDTSGYFIDAIGCSDAVPDKDATRNVLAAALKFFQQEDDLKSIARELKEDIARQLFELSKSDNPECSLDTVDAWVTAKLPEQYQDTYGNKFTEFANNEPFNVPTVFKSHANAAKAGIKMKLDAVSIGWSLNLERNLIGENNDAKIQYIPEQNRLVIKELPERIRASIEAELNPPSDES